MHPDLVRLNRYRLDKDLSFRALAVRVGVPYRTLYALLTRPELDPYDRTLDKIQRFLSAMPAAAKSGKAAAR